MMNLCSAIFVVTFFSISLSPSVGAATPEQVHISLGESANSMVITWLTFQSTSPPIIKYGKDSTNLQNSHVGHTTPFTFDKVTRYVHTGTIGDLEPDTVYYYIVGTKDGWSNKQYNFKTFPSGNDFRVRACVFGDLGYQHGNSIPDLMKAANNSWFDMVIHVGDIAYDLQDDGDKFMNELEPIFSKYPYMVIAGNHENDGQNFSHYHYRFRMPNEANGHHNNQFYSFDLGPAHFFGASTEFYHPLEKGSVQNQYNFLSNDLQKANQNRASRPWIIGYQHRPWYCSNTHCNEDDDPAVRVGFNGAPGLESLYINNKVDLQFWGHMHSYERFYPMANKIPYINGKDPYHNAQAPTYIISGNPGNHHPKTPFGTPHPGSAFRSDDYGYIMMTIFNHTHIHLYQWSVDQHKNIDDVWITKNN